MERNQFTFYRSYRDALRELPPKEFKAAVMAICDYALDETDPSLSGIPNSVFILIRPTLDSGRIKALNRANKNASKQEQSKNKRGTKQEQKPKEEEGEKEGEIEVEKERENDSSIPPTPLSSTGFSPALQSALESWLRYKAEKHQSYKPEGLKALIGEIRNNAARYGEDAVIGLIGKCMSSNWQGIIWDRLKKAEAESGTWRYDPGSMEGSL
nr:MAG TPA: hypothetical protein [Caudoviricetes sp.]